MQPADVDWYGTRRRRFIYYFEPESWSALGLHQLKNIITHMHKIADTDTISSTISESSVVIPFKERSKTQLKQQLEPEIQSKQRKKVQRQTRTQFPKASTRRPVVNRKRYANNW